jgi:hypothetical protein
VHRCDENGAENDQGEFIKVTFSAAVTNLAGKNVPGYSLRYKKSTDEQYTLHEFDDLAGFYLVTNKVHVIPADGNESYDVEVTATDNHGSATRTTSASTAFTLINWHPNGTSMAVGKVSEKYRAVEFALELFDMFGTCIGNGLACYSYEGDHIDADTTIEHHFLTLKGTPTSDFWHVFQVFYAGKTPTSNRVQVALPYDRTGAIFKRYYYGGSWSPWESEALQAYPVGSIHLRYDTQDPAELFGGTWTQITSRVLRAGASGSIGAEGGLADGSGRTYIDVAVWRRTA